MNKFFKNKNYIYFVTTLFVLIISIALYFVFLKQDMYPVNISGIDVNEKPKKIVSLSTPITNFIKNNNYKEVLSGISNIYNDSDETFKDIKRLGTSQEPNIKDIIELKPDYVLTSTPLNNVFKNEIEKNKITVLEIFTSLDYEKMKSFYKDLFFLFEGKSNGTKKYEEYIKSNEEKINSLTSELKIPDDQTFAVISEKSIVSTNDTIENHFISKIVGKSVAYDSSSFEYDINKLNEANPSYLIVKEGIDISNIKETNAFKEGRVIYIDFVGFEQNDYSLIYEDLKKIKTVIYNK